MKLLIALAVLVVGVWLWRSQRTPPEADRSVRGKTKSESLPQEMVRCHTCAMHVPAAEAVVGKLGSYCSVEHLNRSES